ncbi:MAG: hypothetical protein QM503_10570 [Bacteroidota bacterium]
MTNRDLNKLKNKLPSNGVKLIAVAAGYTPQYINGVLSGKKNNLTIIDIAIQVAADHQAELKKKTETINSL